MKKTTSYSKIIKELFVLTIFVSIFSLNSCDKDEPVPNPCENVTCLNGGVCVNGDCDCADGYSGPSCGDQITPTSIRVSKIDVTRFPATESSGGGWDLTSGPDIYVELFKGSTSVWMSSIYYENASQTTYSFNISPTYDITSPNEQYTVRLYDYDSSDADDFMGGIIFYPYSNDNGFPSTLSIDGGGDVAFKLYFSYVW